jgi:hypothetical protein
LLDYSFHTALALTMLNAIFGFGRAETLAVSKQIDGFQDIGLSLAVASGKKSSSGIETNL